MELAEQSKRTTNAIVSPTSSGWGAYGATAVAEYQEDAPSVEV